MESQSRPAFKRILVPLDGSDLAEQSLPYARAIGGSDAELILVHAVPPLEAEHDWFLGRVYATVDEVQERAKADAHEWMLRAAHRWLGEYPNVAVEILDGEPVETIVQIAARHRADLIVLASHGRGTTGRFVFGSVADRVAQLSPVPILIVRPHDAVADVGPVRFKRVLLPLDGSELAKTALPIGATLARAMNVPVVLIQAIDILLRVAPYPGAYAPPPDLIQEAEARAADSLAESVSLLNGAGVRTVVELRVGQAFDTIAGIATPGDIVVMASHGRGGIRRWLLGSVAEKLIRSGPVPVMIVPVAERTSSPMAPPAVEFALPTTA
jgi:nucleotide-binding universal stress UspA family protein